MGQPAQVVETLASRRVDLHTSNVLPQAVFTALIPLNNRLAVPMATDMLVTPDTIAQTPRLNRHGVAPAE